MPGHAQTHDQLIQKDLSFLLLTELQCVLHLQLSILALFQQLIDLQLRPHQHLGKARWTQRYPDPWGGAPNWMPWLGTGNPIFFIISVASRLLHLLRFDQIYRKGICGWLHGYLEENHRTPSCDIVKTHVDVGTLAIRLWQKFKSHHSLMQRWADHAPFLTIRSHSDSGYPETNDFPI